MSLAVRFLTILLLSTLLISCSYFSNSSIIQGRDKEYLNARSIPPLGIPPGLSSDAFEEHYPVSNKTYPEAAKDVSLVPPGLN